MTVIDIQSAMQEHGPNYEQHTSERFLPAMARMLMLGTKELFSAETREIHPVAVTEHGLMAAATHFRDFGRRIIHR